MDELEMLILAAGGLATAILGIWGLVSKATKPFRDHGERITKLENKVLVNEQHLDADLRRLEKMSRVSNMGLENDLLILEHLATGNHNEQMQAQADKIKRYMMQETTKIE